MLCGKLCVAEDRFLFSVSVVSYSVCGVEVLRAAECVAKFRVCQIESTNHKKTVPS